MRVDHRGRVRCRPGVEQARDRRGAGLVDSGGCSHGVVGLEVRYGEELRFDEVAPANVFERVAFVFDVERGDFVVSHRLVSPDVFVVVVDDPRGVVIDRVSQADLSQRFRAQEGTSVFTARLGFSRVREEFHPFGVIRRASSQSHRRSVRVLTKIVIHAFHRCLVLQVRVKNIPQIERPILTTSPLASFTFSPGFSCTNLARYFGAGVLPTSGKYATLNF